MASRIKAIHALRPRIKLGPTVQTEQLAKFIAGRTSLNMSEIMLVLRELHEAIIFYGRSGRGVKLERLGTYLPNLRLDGTLDIHHRQDPHLKIGLNQDNFEGTIINRPNLGKTAEELVALWNEAHPEDPVA